MIEIQNLVKIYTPKNGAAVRALNGINLTLEEAGMVFLLGKSGSGKSTLLNMIGGLDSYDSGDMIVKGKSTKSFTQGDFDSYRNTYVGFVFQEYNILDEFSVARNIGLALELQHKKAGQKEIDAILEKVDLVGYGNRRTTELSGGQKQRVAIARALIKEPQIIMADEPTGALDTVTGKQVFETLKKLSKDKLVIVVSHDRENAEIYADRIIELADGIVINDTQKVISGGAEASIGVTVVDKNLIHIKKGYQLTQEDTEVINQALKSAQDDTFISMDAGRNESFRKAARLTEKNEATYFSQTSNLKVKKYHGDEFKPIKSRLPLRDSLRMGASSLKNKRFRLVLTIILSAMAFVFFGIADTLGSYDRTTVLARSYQDSGITQTSIRGQRFRVDSITGSVSYGEDGITQSEIDYFQQKFPQFTFTGVNKVFGSINNIYYGGYMNSNIYRPEISGLLELQQSELNDYGLTLLAGGWPQKDNEIAISKYLADSIMYFGLQGESGHSNKISLASYEDLFKADINIMGTYYKITAVIDTNFDIERYSVLEENNSNYFLENEFHTVRNYGLHGCIFVSPGSAAVKKINPHQFSLEYKNPSNGDTYGFGSADKYNADLKGVYTADGSAPSALKDDEVIINIENVSFFTRTNLYQMLYQSLNNIISNHLAELRVWFNIPESCPDYEAENILYDRLSDVTNEQDRSLVRQHVEPLLLEEIGAQATALLQSGDLPSTVKLCYQNYFDYYYTYEDYKVAGIYVSESSINEYLYREWKYGYGVNLFSDSTFDKFQEYAMPFSYILTNFNGHSRQTMEDFIRHTMDSQFYETENGYILYVLKDAASGSLEYLHEMIVILSDVFMYAGIVFIVFSMLLMFNFITISISYKKREIGILRAVGARSSDVFGIFLNESFIISAISLIIALVLTVAATITVNTVLRTEAMLNFSLLVFGIRQIAIMLAAAIFISFVSTFLPVWKFARKKPIDAINDR